MADPMECVEGGRRMATQIRRRTRPVEDERVGGSWRRRIIHVARRVHPDIRKRPTVELIEEWTEPIWMLVQDRDRRGRIERDGSCRVRAHAVVSQKRSPVSSPYHGAPELEAMQRTRRNPAPA